MKGVLCLFAVLALAGLMMMAPLQAGVSAWRSSGPMDQPFICIA